jgi:hypothetical protein
MDSTVPADPLKLKTRLETWRATRRYARQPIPDEFRQAAAEMAGRYSPSLVRSVLNLDPWRLKRMNSHRAHRAHRVHRGHNDFSVCSVCSVANNIHTFENWCRARVGPFSVHKILTARAANSAMINRESSDCSIIRTFTHLVNTGASVGEKAVLVLNAKNK